ncbi:hypothetical protein C7M84_011319 [Penaeus vannamei]|uniref:Uncharacterized protein n=1 Tax=Penaeus vannamei TaxID=6689 RepID=A0A3R7M2X7_PENVA|nr:hypothetical protein C7M84_011319 [Penaeus vannamei]
MSCGGSGYMCEDQMVFLNVTGILFLASGGIILIVGLIMYCRTRNLPEPSTTAVTYPTGVLYPPSSSHVIYPDVYPAVSLWHQGYPAGSTCDQSSIRCAVYPLCSMFSLAG